LLDRLELALDNPVEHGVIKSFCRVKGHGFIKKDDGDDIFVHVSEYVSYISFFINLTSKIFLYISFINSIDGEYVPRIGDQVSFRKLLVPPKLEKYQVIYI
jgi:'Cold-shock' DNA-binding domain